MVTLVEQHVIQGCDPRYGEIDAAAFAAKNLYNLGNFTIRQSWLFGGDYIPFAQLYHLLKDTMLVRQRREEAEPLYAGDYLSCGHPVKGAALRSAFLRNGFFPLHRP